MARGGSRVGAGRPKKTEAKERCDDQKEIVSANVTPLEHMLAVMNNPLADDARRDRMAVAAAPFVHLKKGEGGKKDERANAAERVAGGGKFAPAKGPRLVVNNSR